MPDEPTTPEPTEGQETEPQQPDVIDTDPAGDEDDLTKAKRQATHWQREAKKAAKTQAALQAELERIREASKTEAEKALDAARREGRKQAESEWKSKWRTERLHTAALQAMGGRVSDPRLALPHLKFSDELLDDDGNVDAKALTEAVDELLDTFPTLATGSAPAHHADLGPKRRAATAQPDMNTLLRQAAGRS